MTSCVPPTPEDDVYPLEPDLKGWLEAPKSEALVGELLEVRGWVHAPGTNVRAVVLRIGRHDYPLECGLRRVDVETHVGDATAAMSGFEGSIGIGGRGPRRLAFEIRAAFADGTVRRCFAGTLRRPPRNTVASGSSYWRIATGRAVDALREGRLPPSPRRWLASLHRLSAEFEHEARRREGPVAPPPGPDTRTLVTRGSLARLHAFLDSGQTLDLRPRATPRVSVLLVLFNRAELTLDCLRSLSEERGVPLEVVVVDNASTDRTSDLLSRIVGAKIVRHAENVGFLRAVNEAATHAAAPALLLLSCPAACRRRWKRSRVPPISVPSAVS
jgi:hypothetical protein